MTKSEAGQLGAKARKQKLSVEGSSQAALKGVTTIRARDPDFYKRIGSIGGSSKGKREAL